MLAPAAALTAHALEPILELLHPGIRVFFGFGCGGRGLGWPGLGHALAADRNDPFTFLTHGSDDQCRLVQLIFAPVDRIAVIAHPFPGEATSQQAHAAMVGAGFQRQIDRYARFFHAGAGGAQPFSRHTTATVALAAPATGRDVGGTMMALADRAERVTLGTEVRCADATVGAMAATDSMITTSKMVAVLATVTLPAHATTLATTSTIANPTGGARRRGKGKVPTGGTF